jgi:predicted ATPase
MFILVLTGGTLGGKTTIIKKLDEIYGDNIISIPEVSSLLFEKEFKRPEKWSIEWHHSLQYAILNRQLELEELALAEAKEKGVNVIVCDRAMLDPAAYLEGGLEELTKNFGVNEEAALKRYDKIVHLVSLSALNPDLYEEFSSSNPYRIESAEEAKKQEEGSLSAWNNHPDRVILSGSINSNILHIKDIISLHI